MHGKLGQWAMGITCALYENCGVETVEDPPVIETCGREQKHDDRYTLNAFGWHHVIG